MNWETGTSDVKDSSARNAFPPVVSPELFGDSDDGGALASSEESNPHFEKTLKVWYKLDGYQLNQRDDET